MPYQEMAALIAAILYKFVYSQITMLSQQQQPSAVVCKPGHVLGFFLSCHCHTLGGVSFWVPVKRLETSLSVPGE